MFFKALLVQALVLAALPEGLMAQGYKVRELSEYIALGFLAFPFHSPLLQIRGQIFVVRYFVWLRRIGSDMKSVMQNVTQITIRIICVAVAFCRKDKNVVGGNIL